MHLDAAILAISILGFVGSFWWLFREVGARYIDRKTAVSRAAEVKHILELEISGRKIELDLERPSPSSNAEIDRAILEIKRAHNPA